MLKGIIEHCDAKIFYFFNSKIKNNVLDVIFPIITRLGEDLVIVLIGILLFIFGKKRGKNASIIIVSALIFSRLSVLILKRITHRPRPSFVYENVNLIGTPIFSSLPSGHTTLATAICIVLCFKYRGFGLLFISSAILVGMSRLYMGQHFPSDILAGFILGSAVAFGVLYLERFLQENKLKRAT